MISVLFYAFVAFTAIQIIYYLVFSSLLFKEKNKENNSDIPVSVILYVKNAAGTLKENLPLFLNQKYKQFQIIIVNNASYDETNNILEEFQQKHPELKIINIENNENFWGNKKYALTLGIKAAKYSHLLFSDVSCKPVSENWISTMNRKFNNEKTIVIGYKKYTSKSSLLSILSRYKNALESVLSFSFIKAGNPFSGTKENMAYHRNTFYDVNGFINHIKIYNGEDDLFVRDAGTKENTTFSLNSESYIISKPYESFRSWINSLKNDLYLYRKYKWKSKFSLFLFSFSKIGTYTLFTCLLFISFSLINIYIFSGYLLLNFIITGLLIKKYKEPHLVYFIPLLEISLLLIQISIFIAHLFSKPKY